jgi:hypothetical protein
MPCHWARDYGSFKLELHNNFFKQFAVFFNQKCDFKKSNIRYLMSEKIE